MSHFNQIQTGYALVRCALAYGERFLPSHLSHKVIQLTKSLLFGCDLIDAAYVGWKIQAHLYRQKLPENKIRYWIDQTVNAALLMGVGALFVIGMNRLLVPSINLTDLIKSSKIPQRTVDVVAKESIDHLTAVWTKTTLENLTCGLFFIRTILDLVLSYLKSDRLPLFHAAIHAVTTWKVAQYKTLAIQHSFDHLLQQVKYFVMTDGKYDDLTLKYFLVPVKKVEATFYLNTEGLTKPALIEKIDEIYDYSSKMFHESSWYRNWSKTTNYFERILRNGDQGDQAIQEFFGRWQLIYQITLKGNLSPTPLTIRVFHEDNLWIPFKGIEVFRLIPRFATPAQKILFSSWVDAELTIPLTRWDTILAKVYHFFNEAAKHA